MAPASRSARDLSGAFTAHIVRTTLERTGFDAYGIGPDASISSGPSARAIALGGHLVQGHVDGVGTVMRVAQRGRPAARPAGSGGGRPDIDAPGSITVDGVSLTVNATGPGTIQISLIPFTLQHTTLGERRVGDRVHLEADTIGKYVAAMSGKDDRAREG